MNTFGQDLPPFRLRSTLLQRYPSSVCFSYRSSAQRSRCNMDGCLSGKLPQPHGGEVFRHYANLCLTQQFGAVVYALTTPPVLAILNTRGRIESRQSIYYTLGSSEVFTISLSLYQAYALNGGRFSQKSLLGLSANLAPLLLWCLYVLFRKPE